MEMVLVMVVVLVVIMSCPLSPSTLIFVLGVTNIALDPLCLLVWSAALGLCIMAYLGLVRSEEGTGSSVSGETGGLEPPCVCWKSNLGPLREQHVFKGRAISPAPLFCFYTMLWGGGE